MQTEEPKRKRPLRPFTAPKGPFLENHRSERATMHIAPDKHDEPLDDLPEHQVAAPENDSWMDRDFRTGAHVDASVGKATVNPDDIRDYPENWLDDALKNEWAAHQASTPIKPEIFQPASADFYDRDGRHENHADRLIAKEGKERSHAASERREARYSKERPTDPKRQKRQHGRYSKEEASANDAAAHSHCESELSRSPGSWTR